VQAFLTGTARVGPRAGILAAIGFAALAVFQAALAAGAPWGHAAWGGEAESVIRHATISCERSSPTGGSPKTATAFPSSQRSFSIVTGSTSCCSRYASTNSATVSDLETRCSRRSRSSSRSRASAAFRSEANPPRCTRSEPRPPARYR
jgi:hypothetical protein